MWKPRSYEAELLDADDIPKEDLYQNLRELNFINTWLGGHDITLAGLRFFLEDKKNWPSSVSIADVGCGGGDNLKVIAKWARKQNLKIQLVGIDLKQDCIDFAKANCKDFPEIRFVTSDYRLVEDQYDIILSALFCHHLNDKQLVHYLKWSKAHSRIGFFINDLQRHPLAYFSIKYLTRAFSSSYLVKNDAALSVNRGFLKRELKKSLEEALLDKVEIQWKWAFRYLVLFKHSNF